MDIAKENKNIVKKLNDWAASNKISLIQKEALFELIGEFMDICIESTIFLEADDIKEKYDGTN